MRAPLTFNWNGYDRDREAGEPPVTPEDPLLNAYLQALIPKVTTTYIDPPASPTPTYGNPMSPDLKPVSINPEPFVAAVYSLDEARKRMTAPRRLDDMATWTVLERRLAHALHECGLDDDEIKAIVGKLPPGVCEIIHRCPECGARVYPAGPAASRVCGDCG